MHALHIIRLFAACEAGTRRGHYSGYSLIDRRLRTLERASLLSGGGLLLRYMLFACSLLARPAQGAATTVDIRCLSSIADARTSVPTVRMCEELMLIDCSLLARPAQGAATTTDDGLVRYLFVGYSLQQTATVWAAAHPHSPTLIFTSPYTQPWRRSTGTP